MYDVATLDKLPVSPIYRGLLLPLVDQLSVSRHLRAGRKLTSVDAGRESVSQVLPLMVSGQRDPSFLRSMASAYSIKSGC